MLVESIKILDVLCQLFPDPYLNRVMPILDKIMSRNDDCQVGDDL